MRKIPRPAVAGLRGASIIGEAVLITRLAWRSIWRSKRRTLITVCSIGFGLTFAIFFIALGEGMYDQMIDQAVRMQAGYITLEHPDYRDAPAVDLWIDVPAEVRRRIMGLAGVENVKPLILGQGIAKSGAGNMAASIMGVEPVIEARSSPLARNIETGRYLEDSDRAAVVIGCEMAERLNLDIGKKMVLSTNDVNGDLVEELCRVKGIFRTGSEEMDAYFVQLPIGFARRLFHMPERGLTQLGVILKEPGRLKTVQRRIVGLVRDLPIRVLPWSEVMVEVASYIRMDRGSNYIFQGILLFLILFTILNTILMSVLERQREFAMLLALGTRPRQIRYQVLMESVFLGLVGCLVGLILGGLAVYLVHRWGIDLSALIGEGISISGFALTSKLHTKLSASIMLGSAAVVFAATILLSLIPMRRATGMSLVDTLR